MDEQEKLDFYDIIPEYNRAGRLCNYHTGEGETVRVMGDEWERFNQLAGRQHEVIDGIVQYSEALEPTMPDDDTVLSAEAQRIEALQEENAALMMAIVDIYEHQEAANDAVMIAITEVYETILGG